ncbi:MAG: hypothetical protein AUI93_03850 [Crenarchaeota archaeon 13_1_40CM_3_52_10]|nr:MAG: hypothetical protein AUI93_03850 [Crenarchaeota archaeon 13_1_40CM_3_52_10]
MRKGLAERMSPSRTVQKSVTPDSVKALMLIEAIVIALFSFWLANEYAYNVYFRIYVNSIFVEHFTTYTIALGLGIGLAGTAVAATLYKNLRDAKMKLESIAPKIRGSVEKILASVPTMEAQTVLPPVSSVPTDQPAPEAASITVFPVPSVSTPQPTEEKK